MEEEIPEDDDYEDDFDDKPKPKAYEAKTAIANK